MGFELYRVASATGQNLATRLVEQTEATATLAATTDRLARLVAEVRHQCENERMGRLNDANLRGVLDAAMGTGKDTP